MTDKEYLFNLSLTLGQKVFETEENCSPDVSGYTYIQITSELAKEISYKLSMIANLMK